MADLVTPQGITFKEKAALDAVQAKHRAWIHQYAVQLILTRKSVFDKNLVVAVESAITSAIARLAAEGFLIVK